MELAFGLKLDKFDCLVDLVKSAFDPDSVINVALTENERKCSVTLDKGKEVKLFIKCYKAEAPHLSLFNNDLMHIFDKELYFYKNIAGKLDLKGVLPEFFACGCINRDLYMVIEDFEAGGFAVKQGFLTPDEVKVTLRALGAFHGASLKAGLSFEDEVFTDFVNKEENEALCGTFFTDGMNFAVKAIKSVIEEKVEGVEIPSNVTVEKLDKLNFENVAKIFRALRSPVKNAVLLHGDFHGLNVAFGGEGGKLLCKLLDFQEVIRGSPACDLQHFLAQTTSPKMRRTHLDQFLGVYHDSLANSAGDSLPSGFDLAFVKEDYKAKAMIGLMMGLVYILPNRVKDQSKFEEAKKATDSKSTVELLKECVENPEETFQLYLDIINEYFIN